MEYDHDNRRSLLRGISTNNRGNLIWTESFETLQMFVEEVLNISNGTWIRPGGDTKQYKAEDVDIRWYPMTQSITLHGNLKDEIYEKLMSLASISR